MRILKRTLKAVIALLILLALGGGIAYFALLPEIARRVVESSLAGAGIHRSTFDIAHVDLGRMEIRNLSLGKPVWGEVGTAHATYGMSVLWNRHINSLTLDRVDWRWVVRDGRLDLGLSARTGGGAGLPQDLPFDRLEIRELKLALEREGGVDYFAGKAVMTRASAQAFDLDVDLIAESAADVRFGSISAKAPTTQLRLRVTFGLEAVDVTVWPESAVRLDAIAFGVDPDAPRTSPMRLVLAESQQPIIRIGRSEEGEGTWVNAHISAESAFHVYAGGVTSQIPAASGRLAIVAIQGRPAKVQTDLTVSGATIKHERLQLLLTGVEGSIPVDFNQSETRRGPITVSAVTWKDQTLQGLKATLGVADGRAEVEGTWDMEAMGRFAIAPVEFNVSDPTLNISLSCERIGLEPWLPLLTDSRAFGTGSVSGDLTMIVTPAEPQKVSFVRGDLKSDPGGGTIQSKDARALSDLLDESDPRFIDNDQFRQIKDRVIAALEDFAYDYLAIEFKPVDDRVPFSIDVRGKGRRGQTPQELSLTVNFNDFLAVLEAAQAARAVSGARE